VSNVKFDISMLASVIQIFLFWISFPQRSLMAIILFLIIKAIDFGLGRYQGNWVFTLVRHNPQKAGLGNYGPFLGSLNSFLRSLPTSKQLPAVAVVATSASFYQLLVRNSSLLVDDIASLQKVHNFNWRVTANILVLIFNLQWFLSTFLKDVDNEFSLDD
jgi:uncharacterized membrane protein YjfL (UPF0719 family)